VEKFPGLNHNEVPDFHLKGIGWFDTSWEIEFFRNLEKKHENLSKLIEARGERFFVGCNETVCDFYIVERTPDHQKSDPFSLGFCC